MQITHQEIRRFIQLDSDGGLNSVQKTMLESHLDVCADCRKYANSMKAMEITLRPLLKRQWMQQPIPLSIDMLHPRIHSRLSESMLLATRIAAFGIMFIAFIFSAWQLSVSNQYGSTPVLASGPAIPPAPFTSTQRTTATTGAESCTETVYIVQENDTLAYIAFQFSTTREEISRRNNLTSESVNTGTKLIVPVCGSTPTGTVNAIRSTNMPVTDQITSTPIGY